MIIAIDFDGTCVTQSFPSIGEDIGAVPVLKKLLRKNHKLILNTIRDKYYLKEATDWFRLNGIELYGVNYNPMQPKFSSSPKVYAELYIDDLTLGCPTIFNLEMSDAPYVDWLKVEQLLINKGVL